MYGQYCVAGLIGDSIVFLHGNIIKELVDGFIHVFRGRRLLVFNVNEADEEFGVDGSNILQQGVHGALNTLDDFVVNFGAVVGVGHVLVIGAIVGFAILLW